jgi:hypothetical protein
MTQEGANVLFEAAQKNSGIYRDPFMQPEDDWKAEQKRQKRKPKDWSGSKYKDRSGNDVVLPKTEAEDEGPEPEAEALLFNNGKRYSEGSDFDGDPLSSKRKKAALPPEGVIKMTSQGLIQTAASNEESDICFAAITNELKVYGDEIPKYDLDQMLTLRASYPGFFQMMANWDRKYNIMTVSIVLRKLGYLPK